MTANEQQTLQSAVARLLSGAPEPDMLSATEVLRSVQSAGVNARLTDVIEVLAATR